MKEVKLLSYTEFVFYKLTENCSNEELMYYWNRYCVYNHEPKPYLCIYANDNKFLDMFDKKECIQKICNGSYSVDDAYVRLDGCMNFKSSNNLYDLIYKADLVNWIVSRRLYSNEYVHYIQDAIKSLSLLDAIKNYALVADDPNYVHDNSTFSIEFAIEDSAKALVDNSTINEIKEALKLNEANEYVELCDVYEYMDL